MNKREQLEILTKELRKASKAYFTENKEIMSNREYDYKYDQLVKLEQELGYSLPESPITNIGYKVVSRLEKVTHAIPALSLDKTKGRYSLATWLNKKTGILSWKMDGLTIIATYQNGSLIQAATRGNGLIGEDISHNASTIQGLPMTIPVNGKVIIRGEAVISYKDFEQINQSLSDGDTYQNPRNLASGSIRQLDSRKCAERQESFLEMRSLLNGRTKQSKQFFVMSNGLHQGRGSSTRLPSLIRYRLRGQMYPGQACTISDICGIYSSVSEIRFPSTRQTRSFRSWKKT